MIKKIFFLVLISQNIILAGGLTNGFEFLRTDFNPRTSAMAGSYLTIRNDLNALFINPAGMADLQGDGYSFNYTNFLLDINGGSAAYFRQLPKIGVLTVGIRYMDYGDFDKTDEFAVRTGTTFGAHDFALIAGISNHLDKDFTYGVNVKYIYSQIEDYSASALALDFGLQYDVPIVQDLRLAIALRNLGSNVAAYKKTKHSLPKSLSIGGSKKLAHLPLEICVSLLDLNRETEEFWDYLKRVAIGGEFRLNDNLRLRLGYDYDLADGLSNDTNKKFGGVSAGLGINWKNYRIDYSYSNLSILGNIHRFGFSGSLH